MGKKTKTPKTHYPMLSGVMPEIVLTTNEAAGLDCPCPIHAFLKSDVGNDGPGEIIIDREKCPPYQQVVAALVGDEPPTALSDEQIDEIAYKHADKIIRYALEDFLEPFEFVAFDPAGPSAVEEATTPVVLQLVIANARYHELFDTASMECRSELKAAAMMLSLKTETPKPKTGGASILSIVKH